MSQGFSHSDAKGIDREEHIGDDGRNRRAVGLFAKDPGGVAIELSAISTASGVAIPTYELNPTTPTLTLGSVTLNPSDSHIGSVSIYGDVNTTVGNITLNQSPNQIGSVTISNTPSVAQSGSWDIRSALSVASIYGRVEQTNFTAPNTGNVTLNPSPSFIGIVTVANPNAVSGNTTINPGPNQIGSVTISNVPAVTQSGSWDMRSLLSIASIYGNVGITGTPNVSFTGLISLASGTEVKSLATIVNTVTVSPTGLISLASGTEVKSVATVNQGAAAWKSVVTISPRTDYIGLMSVSGNVAVSNWVSPNVGNVTLNASNAYVGLVTVANQIDVRSMLSTATIFAVVNTSAVGNTNALATLLAGPNQIGSVSISNSPTIGTGANWIGLVTASMVGTVNTGMTTLFPGPNQIGSVTISNQPPLISGTAQIGSVTIPHVVNSIATITPRTDYIGLVTATQGNQPALTAGTAQIGSVTVSNVVNSIVTIAPRTDYIGLMTVTNANQTTAGMATLFPGPNQIGSVTISNQPPLIASSAWIGLATTVNAASSAWIGLTTINSGRSMTTSMATVYSAAGNSTLFVPPAGQRFFIHSLMINSQGNQNGNILSGTKPIWPFVGLATTGGFAMTFNDPGLPARLADEAFVVTINSAVTTSVCAAIHFE